MTSTSLLRWTLSLGAILHLGSAGASAGLVFYTSETAFDAAAPTLTTQTFSSANITGSLGASVMANPLNSSTSNSVFAAGSMLPGLTITSSAEHGGKDLDAVASGVFGNTNKAIYNNFGGDSLDTAFSGGTTAVGMGLLDPTASSVSFVVESTSGTQLGSQIVTVNADGPSVFFGVIATDGDKIGSINLLGQGSSTLAFAGIDRIVFAASPATSTPEPASLTLLALGAASLLAFRTLRGRRPGSSRA